MKGSEKFVKKHAEPIDPSFIVLNNRVGPLEFLFASLSLTPHHTCIGQEITFQFPVPCMFKKYSDALLSLLLDPLEGPTM